MYDITVSGCQKVLRTVRLGNKNRCAGEGQQQFISQSDRKGLNIIIRTKVSWWCERAVDIQQELYWFWTQVRFEKDVHACCPLLHVLLQFVLYDLCLKNLFSPKTSP
jgi:hypothetical protein